MSNGRDAGAPPGSGGDKKSMGTLREALAAAAAPGGAPQAQAQQKSPPLPSPPPPLPLPAEGLPALPAEPDAAPAGAADRARPVRQRSESDHIEVDAPQTRVIRNLSRAQAKDVAKDTPPTGGRTQLIRGKSAVKRVEFHQDPVVGWLVVVGGLGLGAFRPIFEGNNTIGRAKTQRIPIDFGDETISSEEQAYLRYDSVDRKFLLVPNLAKTNIVAVNDRKPTSAVELAAMDLITMGRTQLVFVPFCGQEFDWSELTEMKG